jgi:dolichyl-phosphate beta-glucosyltransferase
MSQFLWVIPCFQEHERIRIFLNEIAVVLKEESVQVIVVDDGSGEESAGKLQKVVNTCRNENDFLKLSYLALKENIGKGGAIMEGWKREEEPVEWYGFVDADGACGVNEMLRMMHKVSDSDVGVWIGIRNMEKKWIYRSWYRKLVSYLFGVALRRVMGMKWKDTQCGLKLVRKDVYKKYAGEWREKRFAFDLELLYLCYRDGVRVEEMAVSWVEVAGSKIRCVQDGLGVVKSCWDIVWRHGVK